MITLIFANILVGLSSLLLTKMVCPGKNNSIDFVLSWFSLFLAQIFIAELCLGIIGQLYFSNVLILHSLIFLTVFLIYVPGKNKYPSLPKPDISFLFSNKLLLFAIAVFLGFFLVKVWIKLINPPVFPDALQCHLSFPATWIRNGNIKNPLVIFGLKIHPETSNAVTYYPIGGWFYFYWLMAPLRNAFLADAGQAPFYILGILAIYSILRKFSLKKDTALFLGFLWVLIPNLFKQIKNGAQVDIICAVVFLVVLNHILLLKKEHSLKNFVLLGISLGVFISIKATNIFWSFSLLPLFFYVFYTEQIQHRFFAIAILTFFCLLIGGYSYINNYILTGNIFYPITFKLLGKTLMPGTIDRLIFAYLQYPWEEFTLRKVLFGEGLGLQLFAFIIPGSFLPLASLIFIKTKDKSRNPALQFFLFMVPAIMLIEYFFYIKAFWVRYFFPYLGMGFITAIIFLDRFKWGKTYTTILGSICILSSAAELAHRNELIISLIFSSLLFSGLLFIRKNILYYSKKILSFKNLLILIIISSLLLYFLNEKYNREEFSRYPLLFKGKEIGERDIGLAWKWLNENTGSGKKIAYTGRNEFYPLFGSNLKNDIFYISVNDKPPLPHYYPDGLYRKEKNFSSWINNLKKARIEYLFIALPYSINNESENLNEFPIEDRWASLHPDIFKLIFSNSKAHIYQVYFK